MAEHRPLFPYMAYARSEAFRSPYCLTQSGLPAPPSEWLGPPRPVDLAPPLFEALPQLEARLATLFGAAPEQVLATMGTTGALHLAALGFLREADVVTENPTYQPLLALPELYARSLRSVERRAAEGWALPLEEVEAAFEAAPGRAHLFLTNPNNPTGHELDARELQRVGRAAERAGGVVVVDEVYMECAGPEARLHAFRELPNGISLGSLTKAYGLGALRIGWLILSEELVHERARLLDLAALVGPVDPPAPALRAGLSALDDLPRFLQPLRRFEHESRPLLERFLAETPGVQGRVPRLGLTAFARLEGIENTLEFAAWLAAEHGVDVVPGEYFGAAGHVRISFGLPPGTLSEALERLANGLRAYRARS